MSASRWGSPPPSRPSTQNITTTIDRDVQWYADKALAEAVASSGAESGVAIAQDTRTGEILALSDYPTFDANNPTAFPKADLGARSLSDVYEPGRCRRCSPSPP